MDLNFVYDQGVVSQRQLATLKTVAKHSVLTPDAIAACKHEFEFLDEKHSLHGLYKSFVYQYKRVIDGAKPADGNVLQRAIERASSNELRKQTPNHNGHQKAESEGPIEDAIDWNNFFVLETVEFFSADVNGKSNLSAPLTLQDMQLQRQETKSAEPMFKSPITGELVPASQFNEHIRIHSMAPEAKRQREKERARATTNLDYAGAASNLDILRQKRKKLNESEFS